MRMIAELDIDRFDQEVMERVHEVDEVAETIDAVHDARATAADGTQGIVHTATVPSPNAYEYP